MPMYIPNPAVAGYQTGLQQSSDYARMLQDAVGTSAKINHEKNMSLLSELMFMQKAQLGLLPRNYEDKSEGDPNAKPIRQRYLDILHDATPDNHALYEKLKVLSVGTAPPVRGSRPTGTSAATPPTDASTPRGPWLEYWKSKD